MLDTLFYNVRHPVHIMLDTLFYNVRHPVRIMLDDGPRKRSVCCEENNDFLRLPGVDPTILSS